MIKIDIKGYEGLYSIDVNGNVYSERYNKILKPYLSKRNHTNYYQVDLYKNKKKSKFYIHRLIAIHFLDSYEDGLDVNHIDNNGENNCIENLEFVTRRENILHSTSQNRHKVRMNIIKNTLNKKAVKRRKSMIGNRFGKITITSFDDSLKLIYKCECGIYGKTAMSNILSGATKQCVKCGQKQRKDIK